ncbi:hypothetical protein [Nocardia lijiangensis]|uniref:hypothetical protein n=1 Tax=Nocardia lijiangensis TaxID=299618 RepID=UPI003D73C8F0
MVGALVPGIQDGAAGGSVANSVVPRSAPDINPDDDFDVVDPDDDAARSGDVVAERAARMKRNGWTMEPTVGELQLDERSSLRRVAGLSTELTDITEVEYCGTQGCP